MPRPDSLSESQRDGPRPSLSVPVGSMPSHGELCDDSESDSDGTLARPVTGRAGQQAPEPAACSDPFPTVIPWPSTGPSPRQLRAAVTAARVRRAHAARVARDEVVTVAASWAGDPGSRRPGHRPKRCGRQSQGWRWSTPKRSMGHYLLGSTCGASGHAVAGPAGAPVAMTAVWRARRFCGRQEGRGFAHASGERVMLVDSTQ